MIGFPAATYGYAELMRGRGPLESSREGATQMEERVACRNRPHCFDLPP
jgi:hypothetical protein